MSHATLSEQVLPCSAVTLLEGGFSKGLVKEAPPQTPSWSEWNLYHSATRHFELEIVHFWPFRGHQCEEKRHTMLRWRTLGTSLCLLASKLLLCVPHALSCYSPNKLTFTGVITMKLSLGLGRLLDYSTRGMSFNDESALEQQMLRDESEILQYPPVVLRSQEPM